MENINCKSDRAIVTVTGPIEESMMLQLANSIQMLHHDLYYTIIELEISSPGGSTLALDYCIEIMNRLRDKGVTFTTRALMSTSSAAANLVSLGNRRQAARTTAFLYHKTRAQGVDLVTARIARDILSETDRLDEHYLNLLVKQAQYCAQNPDCEVQRPALAETDISDSDWPIIDYLLVGDGNRQPDSAKEGRDNKLLKLREFVDACLAEDEKFKQLYRNLFDLDRPISAALAVVLRLVDGFVDDASPQPEDRKDGLCVPEWKPLFPPEGQISRNVLCRHTLVLGETGSGKTASGILPIVGSMMADKNSTVGCALIIDPKREIRAHLEKMTCDGITIHHIDVNQDKRPVLNLMARKEGLIEQALADHQYLKAAREILIRSASLSAASPAKILAGEGRNPEDSFWESEGSRLALTVLAFVLLILHHRKEIFNPDKTSVNPDDETSHAAYQNLWEFGRAAGILNVDADLEEIQFLEEIKESLKNSLKSEWVEAGREEWDEENIGRIFDEHRNVLNLYEELTSNFIERIRKTELYRKNAKFRKYFDDSGIDSEKFFSIKETIIELEDGTPAMEEEDLIDRVWEINRTLGSIFDYTNSMYFRMEKEENIRYSQNILALANLAFESLFELNQDPDSQMSATVIVEMLKTKIRDGDAMEIYRQIESRWAPMVKGSGRTIYSIAAYTRTCFAEYTDTAPANALYFGVEPYYRSVIEHGRDDILPLDFNTAVNNEKSRSVYVFQPDLKNNEALVARALKAVWFEAILYSDKREKYGASMPLAAYIADEFHRYITTDKEHGEQSFLDTCRSFGAFCVLACQSISSMKHALAETAGDWVKNEEGVSILLNNTANKLFFRTTDKALMEYMNRLCPSVPGLGLATSIRPPSTLQPGECYASLANGNFERCQLERYTEG